MAEASVAKAPVWAATARRLAPGFLFASLVAVLAIPVLLLLIPVLMESQLDPVHRATRFMVVPSSVVNLPETTRSPL